MVVTEDDEVIPLEDHERRLAIAENRANKIIEEHKVNPIPL